MVYSQFFFMESKNIYNNNNKNYKMIKRLGSSGKKGIGYKRSMLEFFCKNKILLRYNTSDHMKQTRVACNLLFVGFFSAFSLIISIFPNLDPLFRASISC